MKRLQVILFYLIAVPFSLAWLYLGTAGLVEGWSSRSWPCSVGTVETHAVSSWNGRHRDPRHSFALTYSFNVDGVEMTGDRVTTDDLMYGDFFSVGDWGLTRLKASYPPGAKVTVCYDPANPSPSAVLQTGLSFGAVVRVTGGVLVALLVAVPLILPRLRQPE